ETAVAEGGTSVHRFLTTYNHTYNRPGEYVITVRFKEISSGWQPANDVENEPAVVDYKQAWKQLLNVGYQHAGTGNLLKNLFDGATKVESSSLSVRPSLLNRYWSGAAMTSIS
ncbi:unnamed protein product, partial [Amoebophrya sp. A120]